MTPDIKNIFSALQSRLNVLDLKEAAARAEELVVLLTTGSEKFELSPFEKALQQLRNKRMFESMQRLADTLIRTGRGSFKIRRQYAQSMIDLGNYTAAIAILVALIADTDKEAAGNAGAAFENSEARGLMGRAYKQQYVNAGRPGDREIARYLLKAIRAYYSVYRKDPGKVWHGVNAVALIERARRDGIVIHHVPDADAMAKAILELIEDKDSDRMADAWEFATAAEVCIFLNRPEEALRWLSGYARMPYCDAFELGSTLRQLEEVWQLTLDDPTGQLLLPILRAELAKRLGGNVMLDIDAVKRQNRLAAATGKLYRSLVSETDTTETTIPEKAFGNDSYTTYKWYANGIDRCQAVARIGKDSSTGDGTGFLVKGSMLKKEWGEELLLVTNAHVVSDVASDNGLRPQEAIVIFMTLNAEEEFSDLIIRWSSVSTELDTTILAFRPEDQSRLQKLVERVRFYPVAKYPPVVTEPPSAKIYIIGHPSGEGLKLSLRDNLQVGLEDARLRYRTPTDGGSSGSPVFNDQWDLVGIHHATIEKRSATGEIISEINEGISLKNIIDALPNG